MKNIFKKIKIKIRLLVRRKYSAVYNYTRFCSSPPRYKALLYYKTDIFKPWYKERYTHTNNWEISEIVKILNRFGFSVDIIDRKVSRDFMPKDVYDLFIGNAAGNSGRHYVRYAQILKKAVKIFYAAGPEPKKSNQLITGRYAYFKSRGGTDRNVIPRRTIKNDGNIQEAMKYSNYIFTGGNTFCINSYKKHGRETYKIYYSSSPEITFDANQIKNKKQYNFLYFGGGGNIVKGLDLLIETFAKLSHLNLFICAPENESEFNTIYEKIISENDNIHFIGFITVGSKVFYEVTSQCGFIILPSCSEASATSVTTCMRAGLIPIVTPEADIYTGSFGFTINDVAIEALRQQIQEISSTPEDEFRRRIIDSYIESYKYTQQGFRKSFEKALLDVLLKNKLIQ